MSNSAVRSGEAQLHRADQSPLLDRGIRVGIITYGVMHLLIAFIAFQMVVGQAGGEKASGTGAFEELARNGFGRVVLWVMVLGFLMLVVWQVIEAAIGHREDDGGKRTYKRVVSAGKAVLYAALGVSALTVAVNGSSGGSSSGGGGSSADSMTGKLMSAPGGQVLVVLVGLAIIGTGGALAWRGFKEKFAKHLDAGAQGAIITLGKVGYIAKGAALAAVGVLVVIAGIQHNAKKSGGLDAALHELLQQPLGDVLVGAIALGLAAFGVYCFGWARHLER